MAIPTEETVVVKRGQSPRDLTEITVNCPDKVGLGCDLTRIMFEFGLSVARGDLSTDGRWCFLVFWVILRTKSGKGVKWSTLKQRLSAVCPSSDPVLLPRPKPSLKQHSDVFLLQVHADDRNGLLNDMTQTLWELELTIQKVNVSTSPDGKAIDFFFVTDNRNELPAKHRMEHLCEKIREVLGTCDVFCDMLPSSDGEKGTATDLGLGISDCIPYAVENYLLAEQVARKSGSIQPGLVKNGSDESITEVDIQGDTDDSSVSSSDGDEDLSPAFCPGLGPAHKAPHPAKVNIDNDMSPGHSVLLMEIKDRKGLVYDCLRTLKDLNLQVSYGRISASDTGTCLIEMFIQNSSGKKIIDFRKQEEICERMKNELERPIRIVVVNKGVDTELLVATPVEMSGRGRPRALHDVTFILRQLQIQVFKADISRHEVQGKRWEVYRLILQDKMGQAIAKQKTRIYIAHQVRNILMG